MESKMEQTSMVRHRNETEYRGKYKAKTRVKGKVKGPLILLCQIISVICFEFGALFPSCFMT